MPGWLWIVLLALALTAALLRTRVGFRAALSGASAAVELRIGPVRIPIYPGKAERAAEPDGSASRPRRRKKSAAGRGFRPSGADLRAGLEALWPPLRRALARAGRGVRIHPMRMSVTLAGAADPAEAAETYGFLCALLWTVMPAVERLTDLPDPAVHIGVDYGAARTRAEGEIGISLRLGTLLAAALGVGIPAARWLCATAKKHRAARPVRAAG